MFRTRKYLTKPILKWWDSLALTLAVSTRCAVEDSIDNTLFIGTLSNRGDFKSAYSRFFIMDSTLGTKGAPSSPWATRFPLDELIYTSEQTNHSFFAPKGPTISDPKYYDQRPLPRDAYQPLTLPQLDTLFWTEAWQIDRLVGIPTWKAGAFNRHIHSIPGTGTISGGHQPIDAMKVGFTTRFPSARPSGPSPILEALLNSMRTNEERDFAVFLQDRIEVDELGWLPFLQKRRWYDWIQVSKDFDSPPGRTWSVDDPKLWGILRVSLELLNRMLDALIEDRHEGGPLIFEQEKGDYLRFYKLILSLSIHINLHAHDSQLQTILWGRVDYWSNVEDMFGPPPTPDATVLMSYVSEQMLSQMRGVACEWDFIPEMDSQEWRVRLVKLLRKIIWGVARNSGTAEATTNNVRYPFANQENRIILISPQRLELMLNSNLTLAERCMGQVSLTLTMLHELMHCINGARYSNDQYMGNCLDHERSGPDPDEPFLEGAGVPEIGHYMENLFLGGTQFLLPYITHEIAVPPLISVVRRFPWPGCTDSDKAPPYCPELARGAIVTTDHVPSTWASMLLSESFWINVQHPKSHNYFHRNSLFVSETPVGSSIRESRLKALPPQGYRYHHDDVAINDWNERQRIWDEHRHGWYAEAKVKWNDSAWCFIGIRQAIDEFARAFERRDLLKCTNIARMLMDTVDHDKDEVTYASCLPVGGRRNHHWAFYAIGLLMVASIPRLRMAVFRGFAEEEDKVEWALEMTPSKTAAAEEFHQPVYIPVFGDRQERIEAEPIPLYDHFRTKGQIRNFQQRHCLRLIMDLFRFIRERQGVVNRCLMDAIAAAVYVITDDRRKIEEDYPHKSAHTAKWGSGWFFKFPPYDPTYYTFRPDGLAIPVEGQ
ncbi:hypothetical protein F4679DRAFT_589322 [Xylaria curta]|nr:hypothetical protein F4679DRAFT_589322 [Xylaria curta]